MKIYIVAIALIAVVCLDLDNMIHKVLLPIFERSLIFYTPSYVFTYLTLVTVDMINRINRITHGFNTTEPSILFIGSGVKAGCFLSTKIGIEISQEYHKEMNLGYHLLDVYVDNWSQSNNFKFHNYSEREPISYNKTGSVLLNGCHPTVRWDLPIENTKCIWFIRDPLKRLVSFYTYTKQFGEWQVYNASQYVNTIDLEQGVRWVFSWARETIELQDTSYVENFRDRYSCTEVEISELGGGGYDMAMKRVLEALELNDEILLERLRRHDLSTLNYRHSHASKASSSMKKRIENIIMGDDEMRSFVNSARARLNIIVT
jgi:hypothetical protein